MRARTVIGAALFVAAGYAAGCDAERTATPGAPARTGAAALSHAQRRVDDLARRFVLASPAPLDTSPSRATRPAIDPGRARVRDSIDPGRARVRDSIGAATRFVSHGGAVAAELAPAAKRGVLRSASVELPPRADGAVRVTDDRTGVALAFTRVGAAPAPLETTREGLALYAAAADGAWDVVHRVHAEGVEDFVVFEAKPAREALDYEVDVSRAAGLRLVGDVLELVTPDGAPALRVTAPFVIGASGDARSGPTSPGVTTPAHLSVTGCAVDRDPSAPWGRPPTPPGARVCGVHVTWSGVAYPALVDPSWTTTGSMAAPRYLHTATLLSSGLVLVTGGVGVSTAELFDGTTFAATGSMSTVRAAHTASLLPSGKVLVAGGYVTVSTALSTAEIFDGATFAPAGTMTVGRFSHTATLLGSGEVLLAGGNNLSSAELYDGASFTATPPMTVKRVGHTATLLASGEVLLAGGFNVSTAELFDGASFAATGSMHASRDFQTATLLPSGQVLVTGGSGLSSAELFDGVSSFALTGSMAAARTVHTATLLSSGEVLVAGGQGPSVSSELFDGSAFQAVGAMVDARYGHTATLLASGVVVAIGGEDTADNDRLSSAELFAFAQAGATCTVPGECASGLCGEGVCCAAACPNGGVCQRCLPSTGACAAVTSADDPDNCTGSMTCDATGACLLKDGAPANDPAACASGFASDGVCCDAACAGPCDVCTVALGAAADGTCAPAPAGYAGKPACDVNVCDGVSAACPTGCASDADCAPTAYCSAASVCAPQLANGAACDLATDCLASPCRACTGGCVDGVCCATAACGPCEVCAAPLQAPGGVSGACSPALAGSDPHDDCAPDPDYPTSCLADGTCDGAGACRKFAPSNVACAPAACNGNDVTGSLCNGTGSCEPGGSMPCATFACASGACKTQCNDDTDCGGPSYFCDAAAHLCKARASLGGACASDDGCAAGDFCAAGVCCDQTCDGACESCDPSGHCTPTPKGAHAPGKPSCGGSGPCALACSGTSSACASPVGRACGTACADDAETDSSCDASGRCVAGPPRPCGMMLTCDGDVACRATCSADSDCVTGARCQGHACVSGNRCSDDAASSEGASGKVVPCSPYLCDAKSGACRQTCSSAAECASGFLCDPAGNCVAPPAQAPAASSGCALAAPASDGPAALLASIVLLVAALRRRSRGARRAS